MIYIIIFNMNVSTQTYSQTDKAVQVPAQNINLIISETNIRMPEIVRTRHENSYSFKSNSILYRYHKEFNEKGHSIFKWRDEQNLHKNVAVKALSDFRSLGLNPPYWLNRRAK
jgi:hypothetical protein